MKGVIFNLLEEVVSEEAGEAVWEQTIADAGVEGAYTSLGTYPHTDLVSLVVALAGSLDMEADEVVRWFGRRALGRLAISYPGLFERHETTGQFLLTLNHVIHPEVRKLYPGAEVPVFDYRLVEPDRMLMGYRSHRGLCSLGHGLIEGAAPLRRARRRGAAELLEARDAECVFEMVFGR